MSTSENSLRGGAAENDNDRQRRSAYLTAYQPFTAGLSAEQRTRINGSAQPAWENRRTFALPVNADSPAYRSEDDCPVTEALEEISEIRGAVPKIALWLNDKMGGLDFVKSFEQFRTAIARISEAKNPRLEADVISLAIGMNLRGNANGFALARHYALSPQAFHEYLSETCKALGLPKPLAKIKTDRYRATQYRHNLKKKVPAE